jgi:hypothetical protein
MIQLTKGTNVLDINLSDFSGAGQDVVQNGSFDDIGSDLVQNGDFAEIGSELVTNGDFSAASSNLVTNPNFTDTGSELVLNNDFTGGSTSWTVIENTGGSVTFPTNQCQIITDGVNGQGIRQFILTTGKSYKVVIDIASNTNKFQVRLGDQIAVVSGSGVQTFYGVATATDLLIYRETGEASDVVLNSVSVKELGADWTLGTGINISDGLANFTGSPNANINQDAGLITGKSYKIVFTISNYVSGDIDYNVGGNTRQGNIAANGTYTDYVVSDSGSLLYFQSDQTVGFVGSISSISVQELGADWTATDTGSGSISFVENGMRILTEAAPNAAYCNQTGVMDIGKSYKFTYTVSANSSAVGSGFYLYDNTGGIAQVAYADLPQTVGTHTVYFVAGDDALFFNRYGNDADITLTNISVKEVGQDWTVQEPDGQSVTFPNSTLSIIYDSTETQGSTGVYQDILTIGKYYKIEIDVASITGDLKLQVGSDSQVINTTGTSYFYTKSDSARIYIVRAQNSDSVSGVVNSISIKQLDTNDRWVTFADPDSKSVMKQGQVDLEIDSSGNNCGVYQTGLIKPNKLYIITINMKATAAINVEIAASLGTAVSAVIGTETLTTSYKEYSFEYVTPFAVDHDLQIHRLFGSGASQTISIDYVSMNGVDESQWTNDPTWDPFATSLVFVPTLTDESTNNSKQFTLDTSITDGGWDGRSLHGQVIINEFPTEVPASGIINLKQPDFLEGFYQVEIRGYLGTFYRVLGKCMAHLERASTEDGYNRFESYNDTVTYKAYEE